MAERRRGGGKGMISYQNIRSGLDFVKSFKEAQKTIDSLEIKAARLRRERDRAKQSLEVVKYKYRELSLENRRLKMYSGPVCGYPF